MYVIISLVFIQVDVYALVPFVCVSHVSLFAFRLLCLCIKRHMKIDTAEKNPAAGAQIVW